MTAMQQTSSVAGNAREAQLHERGEEIKAAQSAVSVHPVTEQKTSEGNSTVAPRRSEPAVVSPYPAWPTSQPGPLTVPPPPGQHPHPLRTEQMIYEYYDQEHGRSYIPVTKPSVQEHRSKIYTERETVL